MAALKLAVVAALRLLLVSADDDCSVHGESCTFEGHELSLLQGRGSIHRHQAKDEPMPWDPPYTTAKDPVTAKKIHDVLEWSKLPDAVKIPVAIEKMTEIMVRKALTPPKNMWEIGKFAEIRTCEDQGPGVDREGQRLLRCFTDVILAGADKVAAAPLLHMMRADRLFMDTQPFKDIMDTREEEETGVPFDDEARIFNTRSTDYAKMLEDHWNMTRIISDTRVGLVLNLMWGPTYSYHPNAPFHLPKVYPDEKMQKMKFVFVIREPTSRAVASWRSPKSKDTRSFEQVLHDGIQQRRNLEACYDGSLSRSSKPANFVEELSTEQQLQVIDECWWQRDDTHDQTTRLFGESVEFVHAHVDQGIYVDQLRRWFNLHGRNNTFVYSAEEWAENPQQTYGRIAEFFGIQVVGVSGFKNASVYNTTIDEATQKGEEDPSTLREEPSKEIQDQLREFYRPYNEQLWKLLGRKLY